MHTFHPDHDTISLGVRQPWIELILRGHKTIEVRSQNTQVRGTIYLYSSRKFSDMPVARVATREYRLDPETLPLGLLVGSVDLWNSRPAVPGDASAACVPAELLEQQYAWELRNPRRFPQPVPVRFLPYGVWFYPFRRRTR
ncbi:MAG: ASCH domain-containing protein [Planctomycetes bacterium]|nr:ASCH domain-containing protein [Planctomycetota bacterium]